MATNKAAVLALLGPSGVSSGSRVATWENSSGYNRGLVLPDGTTRYGVFSMPNTAIPFIVPNGDGATAGLQFDAALGDGTFAIVGALTIPVPAGGCECFMYFPANQIAGTSNAAGWYYTILTSATAGKVYNNLCGSAFPVVSSIPAVPTAFTGVTGSAWLTQSTAQLSTPTLTVPGGLMGPTGRLIFVPYWTFTNSAGSKNLRTLVNGTIIQTYTRTTTANQTEYFALQNRNDVTRQSYHPGAASNGTAAAVFQTFDTAADLAITVTIQNASTADSSALMNLNLQVIPGA